MAKFEVFIPAAGAGSFDLTLRVDADNWLAALDTGMKKIGEKGGPGANLLVDIQDDNTIHVTDPRSQRVFRIKEAEEVASAPAPGPAASPAPAPAPSPFDPQPSARTQLDLPTVSARPATEPFLAPAAPAPRPVTEPLLGRAPPVAAPTPARPRSRPELRRPSSMANKVVEVPAAEVQPPPGKIGRERPAARPDTDEVLAELFERVQETETRRDPEEALYFLLDLAMEKIAAESGSVFLADLSTNDLTLGAARGPKSKELIRLNPRVPMGVGIVGFCSMEGVSVAISDAQRDPRFFRAISDRIGYETRSILCSPMLRGGRSFGCIEILNKKASTRFTEFEVAILNYLAEACGRYLDTVG